MSAPRVLGYDDLWQYLGDNETDARIMAAEYDEQGDIEQRDEQIGRAQAFGEVRSHIEFELDSAR